MSDPVTPKRIAQFFQNEGYKGKIDVLESSCCVRSSTDGKNFSVYFYPKSTDADASAESVQIVARFILENEKADVLAKLCNTFNQNWRFVKTYIAEDAIVFEQDVMCEEGIGGPALTYLIDTYRKLLNEFLAHIQPAL